jgi:hypothetical protein
LIFLWGISSAIGWTIGKSIQEAEGFVSSLYIGKAAGWSLGWAISGVIGGYVLGWQLLKDKNDQVLTDSQKTFLLSWIGRTILGGAAGIILALITSLLESYFFDLIPPLLIIIIGCSLAGLIVYPHKLSMALLPFGFLIAGVFNFDGWVLFVLSGVYYGFLGVALISRVLFWLKVIK